MAAPGHASLEHDRAGEPAAGGQVVEYEAFIEQKLKQTRSHVRSVDISAGIMILLAGTLGYFLFAGLLDHWLIGGGLGFWGRLLLLAVFLVAAAWWIATQIAPLLFKRINPLYAAQAIEQSRPTLKNTLLNFLLFRANPAGVHARVLEAIEEQAATNLAGVQVESAVDRTRLIRLGYVLVGILVVCALYMVLSPKDLIKTVRRVAMPWADISSPTRTVIDEITPGDAQAFRGQQVKVQARVGGLPESGKVMLYYTTADRQIVDRAVAMSRPADDHRHVAVLPAGDSALQQTLTYRIEAGDAVTREYTIEVVAAPTIVVKAIEYKYPDYTGLLAVRVEHQGDIKAIEGTQVTLEALANQDIESAHVDFDCNDTLDLRMRPERQTAVATFDLSLREDRRTPEHGSYQVIFKNAAGRQNPQPLRHQIEVTRDIGPEIQFVAPGKDDIELPLDAAVELEVVAGDPDFALSQVQLSAAKGEAKVVDEALLGEPWRGQFVKKFRFLPLKLGLKPGDVVDYWAVAVDNKTPAPNRTETSRRRIRIVSESGRPGQPDQVAKNDKRDDPQGDAPGGGDEKQPRDQQSEPDAPKSADGQQPAETSEPGEPQPAGQDNQKSPDSKQSQSPQESKGGSGDSGQEQPGEKPSEASDEAQGEQGSRQGVPNDGTNDGEAIERILKHRQQQNPQDKSASDEQKQPDAPDQPSGDEKGQSPPQQRDGSQESAQQKDSGASKGGEGRPSPDGKQGGGQQDTQSSQDKSKQQQGQPQDKNAAKPGDPMPRGDNSQPGDKEAGEKQRPGEASGQQESSGSKDRQSSDEKGQSKSGKQPSGESKPSSDKPDVERQRGEGNQGQKQPDGAKPNQPGQRDPRQGATQDNNTREDGTPQKPTQGQGGQSQDDPTRQGDQKSKQDNQQSPDAKGGDGEQQKGESGAGKQSPDKKGSPAAQDSNQPRKKSQQPGPDEKDAKRDGPAQSPSNSKRESDSQGQQDGDRSGGGKKGGGQKANKPGTGGAGQNTAADEGAGKSDEAGDGETSDRAGGDRQADGKTGHSGSESGDGSKAQSSGGENEKPGGDDALQEPSDAQSPSGEQNNPGPGGQGSGTPGASRPGSSTPQDKEWKPGVDQADAANLEYARKATDLALQHLRDQLDKGQPDQDLLDRLGWSPQDLEKFVKRWEAMRGSANAPGDPGTAARRELDETLRSLGLRPRATTLKSNAGRDDRAQGYQESHRTTPPPEFTESFKAYTQGTARGGK